MQPREQLVGYFRQTAAIGFGDDFQPVAGINSSATLHFASR